MNEERTGKCLQISTKQTIISSSTYLSDCEYYILFKIPPTEHYLLLFNSWLITGFVTRLTRWVPLVEQELLTLTEHLSSLQVFSGVRVTWSLVLYVCFVDHCLSLCTFSFGHCVVCSSSIYGFWLPSTPLKTWSELRCSVRVSSSCSTSGTHRVNLVTNPVISHEWGKDREVFTNINKTNNLVSKTNPFFPVLETWLIVLWKQPVSLKIKYTFKIKYPVTAYSRCILYKMVWMHF
jgi:hypothetical protein